MNKHIAWMTLALSAATPVAAQNTAQASASLTQFTYSLVDLAPGDGIAPSITFGDHLTLLEAYVWQTENGAHTKLLDGGDQNHDGTLSARAQTGATFAKVQNSEATSWAQAGLDVSANGFANFGTYYSLTPHTRLVFHWLAGVASTIGAANRGIGETHVRATISQSTDGNYTETSDFLRSSAGVGDAARDMWLQVQTGENAAGGFYSGTAWSQSVALVPEPHQWAMWLAGLGMGLMYGRRRASP
jgi:hypothetical protein